VAAPPNGLTCDVTGLNPITLYTFTVTATNAVGSTTSPATLVPALPAVGTPPVLPPPAAPAAYVPPAVVDINLTGAAATTIDIPGYVSTPQGRFNVNNPNRLDVRIAGGVLASQFTVADARASGPNSLPIGFVEAIVLRKFRIVSTTTAGPEVSTAIVQVKEQGAYGVNSWAVQ
jgi:hypothetical protein